VIARGWRTLEPQRDPCTGDISVVLCLRTPALGVRNGRHSRHGQLYGCWLINSCMPVTVKASSPRSGA